MNIMVNSEKGKKPREATMGSNGRGGGDKNRAQITGWGDWGGGRERKSAERSESEKYRTSGVRMNPTNRKKN